MPAGVLRGLSPTLTQEKGSVWVNTIVTTDHDDTKTRCKSVDWVSVVSVRGYVTVTVVVRRRTVTRKLLDPNLLVLHRECACRPAQLGVQLGKRRPAGVS